MSGGIFQPVEWEDGGGEHCRFTAVRLSHEAFNPDPEHPHSAFCSVKCNYGPWWPEVLDTPRQGAGDHTGTCPGDTALQSRAAMLVDGGSAALERDEMMRLRGR